MPLPIHCWLLENSYDIGRKVVDEEGCLTVRLMTETSIIRTHKDILVDFPFNACNTIPIALAAPVLQGMMLKEATFPHLQALLNGPSTVFCVVGMK